ncbi:MAG TPA: roadblock/LC7 domain-containing protein [Gemmatimonadales bacterium]|nr:roadblock/LC7 domain-containing protein [Gemmatimonadales bacterium]
MTPLAAVLAALVDRPEVAGVAVVSDEGLIIEAQLDPAADRDAIAALAATALRGLDALGEATGRGAPRQVVLESAGGATILHRLPTGATLVVLATIDGSLGQLLHELRRHAPALIEVV